MPATADLTPRFRTPRTRSAVRALRVRPAAGILLRHHDDEGWWYLLGLRTETLGGTWANFGGSLDPGEDALVGALRELEEEAGVTYADLANPRLIAALDCSASPAVPYTLFVIDVENADDLDDLQLGWENDNAAWFHSTALTSLDLHRGLAAVVDQVLRLEANGGRCVAR